MVPYFFDVKVIFLISGLVISLVSIISYLVGKKYSLNEKNRISPMIPSSIFGLLALILSFTFSMAISRYEDRRRLTVEEANAISTAYLRARLLREVPGIDIEALYRRYLEERIAYYDNDLLREHQEKSEKIYKEIWKHYEAVLKQDRGAIESLYSYALNDMIDYGTRRNFALIKTLPLPIYLIIFFIAIVAFGSLNFDRGFNQERPHWGAGIFLFLFIVLFSLIYDIDHSRRGVIRISQDALIDARDIFDL